MAQHHDKLFDMDENGNWTIISEKKNGVWDPVAPWNLPNNPQPEEDVQDGMDETRAPDSEHAGR